MDLLAPFAVWNRGISFAIRQSIWDWQILILDPASLVLIVLQYLHWMPTYLGGWAAQLGNNRCCSLLTTSLDVLLTQLPAYTLALGEAEQDILDLLASKLKGPGLTSDQR